MTASDHEQGARKQAPPRPDETWAVLPVKAWSEAKRRLSPVLDRGQREDLARSMLRDLLDALAGAAEVSGVLAVTADRLAADYLASNGCEVLAEPRRGLNRALETAAAELVRRGISTMLVLPIDLPLATADDLDDLCSRHLATRRWEGQGTGREQGAGQAGRSTVPEDSMQADAPPRHGVAGQTAAIGAVSEHCPVHGQPLPAVTVAPDRFRSGTNALLCSPPDCIPFRFGDGSFHAHLREAKRVGAAHSPVVIEGIGLDVDHPDDLAELLRRDRGSRSARLLAASGLNTLLPDG